MPRYGFTLFSELNGPDAQLEQAIAAEEAGFDFLGISDHFHPWLSRHTDSPFTWTTLGAVAARTERVELVTLVTCPIQRYHPAIIAQAAATVQILSGGRFTLGLGSGENLSEHITGEGWPPIDVRHEMTRRGGRHHPRAVGRRLGHLPRRAPDRRGRQGLVAARHAAAHRRSPRPVRGRSSWPSSRPTTSSATPPTRTSSAGSRTPSPTGSPGPRSRSRGTPTPDVALDAAHHFAFGAPGWKVMAELPNVPGFDAVADLVDDDTIRELVATGPDPAAAHRADHRGGRGRLRPGRRRPGRARTARTASTAGSAEVRPTSPSPATIPVVRFPGRRPAGRPGPSAPTTRLTSLPGTTMTLRTSPVELVGDRLAGGGLHRVAVGVRGDRDPPADLAVDLDDDLDLVVDQQRGVRRRPAGWSWTRAVVAETAPQLLGDERADRREHRQQRLERLADRGLRRARDASRVASSTALVRLISLAMAVLYLRAS